MNHFLNETIDILASYFFDKSVVLENVQIHGALEEYEEHLFRSEINLRHDIAYGRLLVAFFDEINLKLSTNPDRYKTFSELPLRGQLDINRYLQRRYCTFERDRYYPVIRGTSVPNTPENILIKSSLVLLVQHFTKYPLKQTAEFVAVQQLLNWLHNRLSTWPWDLVMVSNNLERTYLESRKRVTKRQTGDDAAYDKFLLWFEDWQIAFNKPHHLLQDQLRKHLLAFPTGDSFNEKVFEIWCLKFLSKVLISLGFSIIFGPKPLHKKNSEPIYTLERNGDIINIWFQKQAPMGKPQWYYTDSKRSLRGIPDIILTQVGLEIPLVIDAKLRSYNKSKSEEVYKMLGYYENFRKSFDDQPYIGALLFVSDIHEIHELENDQGCRVSVLSVPPTGLSDPLIKSMGSVIENWLQVS